MDCENGYHKINDRSTKEKIFQYISNHTQNFLVEWIFIYKNNNEQSNKVAAVRFNNTEAFIQSTTDDYLYDDLEFHSF